MSYKPGKMRVSYGKTTPPRRRKVLERNMQNAEPKRSIYNVKNPSGIILKEGRDKRALIGWAISQGILNEDGTKLLKEGYSFNESIEMRAAEMELVIQRPGK